MLDEVFKMGADDASGAYEEESGILLMNRIGFIVQSLLFAILNIGDAQIF